MANIFGLATFFNNCIVPQTRRAVQGNTVALNAVVVGIAAGLVGVEVHSMIWTDDISAAERYTGIRLNIALQCWNLVLHMNKSVFQLNPLLRHPPGSQTSLDNHSNCNWC